MEIGIAKASTVRTLVEAFAGKKGDIADQAVSAFGKLARQYPRVLMGQSHLLRDYRFRLVVTWSPALASRRLGGFSTNSRSEQDVPARRCSR